MPRRHSPPHVMVVMVLLLMLVAAGGCAAAEPNNSTMASEQEESVLVGNDDEAAGFDGGFSSLDSMLQWAIGHSDPEKLKETAQIVQQMSAEDIKNRQLELRELMEESKMPSDGQLMQMAITVLNDSSLSMEDHRRALDELLVLVEPIDNANNLDKLGGLLVVIRELNNSNLEIRIGSAWVLGTASQNNPNVQNQVLKLGALPKLVKMINSSSVEEATKALYAVSAVIRNNLDGVKMFFAEGGDLVLQDIMSNSSKDVRLHVKSTSLVTDLAEWQLENTNVAEIALFRNRFFLKSVVDLATSSHLDLQEKALVAVKILLQLKTTEALDFKDFCDLSGVMERMRGRLQQLMAVESQRDFASYLENLCQEVEMIFQRKLEKLPVV